MPSQSSNEQRQRILQMMTGFQPMSVIGAAAELDLWSTIGFETLSADAIASRLRCDFRATVVLLDAVAALGFLKKSDSGYSVDEELSDLLTEDSEITLLPMIRHWMSCLRSWSQLAWTVRSGVPAPKISSIRGPMADREAFIAGMHSLAVTVADDLVSRLSVDQFDHMLDVGGASGSWTLAFLRKYPNATATIFDLPDAVKQAESRIADSEMADRIEVVGGDFFIEELPGDIDFAWVSAIVHMLDRQQNSDLFAKIFRALQPGGRIAIRDIIMKKSRTEPVAGALFAINMLVNTTSGGTYTFDEMSEDLIAAGFVSTELTIESEDMNAVVTALKP